MMFSMTAKKKEDVNRRQSTRHVVSNGAPTKEEIQKRLDEQSFNYNMRTQWADLKRKIFFVPVEVTKVVVSGEYPFVNRREEKFKVSFLQRIFLLFDQPEHCFLGEIISFITMVVILISCVGYIASTGERVTPNSCKDPACENDPTLCPDTMICPPEEKPVFELIETICISFFTFDYFVRLFLVPLMPARLCGIIPSYFDRLNSNAVLPTPTYSTAMKIWRYMTMPMNVIDLVAILPFYVAYFSTSGGSVSIIRILRLVRVLRVFKIGGMGNGMTLMGNAMMNSLSAMGILLFFTVLGVILFGSIIYFCESGKFVVNEEFPDGAYIRWNLLGTDREESPFTSILVSCYWAMVTFTTVGYGDLVPTSPGGRFVALVLMYSGILVLALPISVIGANFQREYERLESDEDDESSDLSDEEDIDWESSNRDRSDTLQSAQRPSLKKIISLRSTSSGAQRGSFTKAQLEMQVDRLVKKSIVRERRNSNVSVSTVGGDDMKDQLKALNAICMNLTDQVEALQMQQNNLIKLLTRNEKKSSADSCDDNGEYDTRAEGMSMDGIELKIRDCGEYKQISGTDDQ